jgi:hypothetical protein
LLSLFAALVAIRYVSANGNTAVSGTSGMDERQLGTSRLDTIRSAGLTRAASNPKWRLTAG